MVLKLTDISTVPGNAASEMLVSPPGALKQSPTLHTIISREL